MTRGVLGFIVMAGVTLVGGCGKDTCGGYCPQPDAAVQEDAQPEDAQADAGEPFTLRVRVIYGHGPDTFLPAPEATVALDVAGGELQEKPTDAQGRVAFSGNRAIGAPLAVTAYLPGLTLASRVGITDTTEEVELWLPTRHTYPGETVTISGTAQNRQSLELFVSTTQSDWFLDRFAADWSLLVRKDAPFTLVALDEVGGSSGGRDVSVQHSGWFVLDHPGVSADATVDLDFATQAVTPKSVQGSFNLSRRPGSLMAAKGYGWLNVCNEMGEAYVGFPTETKVSADGTRVDYTVEWVEPAAVTTVQTVYLVWYPWADAQRSEVRVDGYPTAGPHELVWIEAPLMTAPSDPKAPHPLYQPLTWTRDNFGTDVRLVMERTDRPASMWGVWHVYGPAEATTLTVPKPPSTVDVAEVLGTAPLHAYLAVMDRTPSWRPRSLGLSKQFTMAPPQ